MRLTWTALLLVIAMSGCTCRGERTESTPAAPSASATAQPFALQLQRTALIAFGSTIPLPVSNDFAEEVPALRPPLERAAKLDPGAALPIRVARDVPYGQLTRLMQAALPYRVTRFLVWSDDAAGAPQSVATLGPSPFPADPCWVRGWVGPDARVLLGLNAGTDAGGVRGVLVNGKQGALDVPTAMRALRRAGAGCARGQARVYSQPTARFGPAFDLALAVDRATPPLPLREIVFAVPSIGPIDAPDELSVP